MKKFFATVIIALACLPSQAQIMLSPIIESTINGLTENNMTIAEGRLRNVISSLGMESGYGGRFVLACKVAALQREVSGSKLIQHLEISFAVGDNMANACFGSTSMEAIGIGSSEGQAMTSALKNIKSTPQLKKIVAEAKQRIIDYYEKNGPSIIKKAQGLITAQQWEEALYELTAIPEECSCYKQALAMMEKVYETQLNHDAAQILAQAQAMWAADPNPGYTAEEAMRLLGQINTSAACYPQAQALMKKIEARTKAVTDREYRDKVAMDKARLNAAVAVTKARIQACRDVAVAYARRKVVVRNYYRSWW
jgi:hypothetical protein